MLLRADLASAALTYYASLEARTLCSGSCAAFRSIILLLLLDLICKVCQKPFDNLRVSIVSFSI